MKHDIAIAYPFPMHLSQGFTYHLSILQFALALSRRIPVFLICLDTRSEIEELVESQFDEKLPAALNVRTVANRKFGIKSNTLWFRYGVRRIIRRLAPEYRRLAIYTRNVKLGAAIFSAKARLPHNVICVFESHQLFSQNLSCLFEFSRARREFLMEQRLYSGCDLIFVNTSLLGKQIKRAFQKDSIVLPVGVRSVDLVDLSSLKSADYSARTYDFVYAGSFDEWKGVEIFIEALSIISNKGWKGRAALIGLAEKDIPAWNLKLSNLGIAQQVVLLPKSSKLQVNKILDQSRIGVIPNSLLDDSLWSTSPLKLFDYSARGLRLVVSTVPAIYADVNAPDIVWFKPDDPEDMARGLIEAIQFGSEPSVGNYRWVNKYTWENRADRVCGLMEKLNSD